MHGLMMDRPLLISSLLEHAACVYREDGDRHPHGRGAGAPLHWMEAGSALGSWPRPS
jgi:hypothetical protein